MLPEVAGAPEELAGTPIEEPQENPEGEDENLEGETKVVSHALVAYDSVWPEGTAAKEALQNWCKDEGVPGPPPESPSGHRPRISTDYLGFFFCEENGKRPTKRHSFRCRPTSLYIVEGATHLCQFAKQVQSTT